MRKTKITIKRGYNDGKIVLAKKSLNNTMYKQMLIN